MGSSNSKSELSGSFDEKDAHLPEWAVNRQAVYQKMKNNGAKSFVLKNEAWFDIYLREIKKFGICFSI